MSTLAPHRSRPMRLNVVVAIGAFLLVATLGTALIFMASGGRWFIVSTPSMGTAAPVGTLILTTPTGVHALHVGEIISFHPPTAPSETFTHRILAISPHGTITTKGDINGATDPWTLRGSDLIGKAIVVLPAAGWIVRAIPILVIGIVLVLLLTRLVRALQWRASLRIVGVTLVVSIAAYVLRPFTGVIVLQTYVAAGKAGATVVSTGLLPIRITAEHGNHVDLVTGQVGQLSIPTYLSDGYYRISSALHLGILGWVIFVLVCCTPLIGTMLFGLPPKDATDGGTAA